MLRSLQWEAHFGWLFKAMDIDIKTDINIGSDANTDIDRNVDIYTYTTHI